MDDYKIIFKISTRVVNNKQTPVNRMDNSTTGVLSFILDLRDQYIHLQLIYLSWEKQTSS